MRRLILAAAAAWIAPLFLLPIGVLADEGAASKAPKPPARAVKGYSRSVNYSVRNSSTGESSPPRVSGQGGFPVRLDLLDKGRSKVERRLQVFVSVNTQADPSNVRPKVGERVQLVTDPKIYKTGPDEDGRHEVGLDIPLPPGDYVAHVFVCDPDRPHSAGVLDHRTIPAAEEFPGMALCGKAFIVHVEPED